MLSFGVSEAELSPNTSAADMTKREEQGERPKFGPRPKFDSMDFDFNKEMEQLPFPVNIGEVEFSLSQQKCFWSSCMIIKALSHYVMSI